MPHLHRLSPQAQQVIQHPWVKRLSHISQLGFVPQVWPETQYSRLTHSVGVAMLTKLAVSVLGPQSPEPIPERASLWLELAGLLHDVGHGPFSHVFDQLASPRWRHHEWRGQLMIPRIFQEIPGLTEEDAQTVLYLIQPRKDTTPPCPQLPMWLTTLVSNPYQDGCDLDRLDYLQRDSALLRRLALQQKINLSYFRPLFRADTHRLIRGLQISKDAPYWRFHPRDAELVSHAQRLRTLLHYYMYRHPRVLEWEKTAEQSAAFRNLTPCFELFPQLTEREIVPSHVTVCATQVEHPPREADAAVDVWRGRDYTAPLSVHPEMIIDAADWARTQTDRVLVFVPRT